MRRPPHGSLLHLDLLHMSDLSWLFLEEEEGGEAARLDLLMGVVRVPLPELGARQRWGLAITHHILCF